jgi:hypothetical protein
VRQDWEPEDLIEVWTLLEDDMKKVRNKSGATRLGLEAAHADFAALQQRDHIPE